MRYLKVLVSAGAKRERVVQGDKRWAVTVKELAAGNAANKRVREVVAARLGVALTKVRIQSGHHAKSELLAISD